MQCKSRLVSIEKCYICKHLYNLLINNRKRVYTCIFYNSNLFLEGFGNDVTILYLSSEFILAICISFVFRCIFYTYRTRSRQKYNISTSISYKYLHKKITYGCPCRYSQCSYGQPHFKVYEVSFFTLQSLSLTGLRKIKFSVRKLYCMCKQYAKTSAYHSV